MAKQFEKKKIIAGVPKLLEIDTSEIPLIKFKFDNDLKVPKKSQWFYIND